MNYECMMCGQCCTVDAERNYISVIIAPYDLASISNYLGIDKYVFLSEYCIHTILNLGINCEAYLLKAHNGKCIFLDHLLCKIHETKPMQCKLAPHNFFSGTNLWNHLPCYSSKEKMFNVTEHEIEFVRSLLNGYSV